MFLCCLKLSIYGALHCTELEKHDKMLVCLFFLLVVAIHINGQATGSGSHQSNCDWLLLPKGSNRKLGPRLAAAQQIISDFGTAGIRHGHPTHHVRSEAGQEYRVLNTTQ
jgi:hypothetical protein